MTFYLVWRPDGPTNPQYRHDSVTHATIEAERLAREHQGKRFYVLESVLMRQVDNMTRVDLRAEHTFPDDGRPF